MCGARLVNPAMDADLTAIKAALAEFSDTEFHALIAATNGAPPVAYGLLVWIEGAADWELNRRAGHEYELLPPEVAIDPVSSCGSSAVTEPSKEMPWVSSGRSSLGLSPE